MYCTTLSRALSLSLSFFFVDNAVARGHLWAFTLFSIVLGPNDALIDLSRVVIDVSRIWID